MKEIGEQLKNYKEWQDIWWKISNLESSEHGGPDPNIRDRLVEKAHDILHGLNTNATYPGEVVICF